MWRKIIPSLMLAFTLAACESRQDIERKPAVVEDLIENSIARTDTGAIAPVDGADFKTRLRAVLMECRTRNLETLRDQGVTIALDQRLAYQNLGMWDRRIDGIFYNNGDRVIGLWDDGRAPEKASFWHMDATDYGPEALGKMADHLRDGDVSPKDKIAYAARYTVHSGKSNYTTTRWRTAEDFDKDSIKKNPDLASPPLRTTKKDAKPMW